MTTFQRWLWLVGTFWLVPALLLLAGIQGWFHLSFRSETEARWQAVDGAVNSLARAAQDLPFLEDHLRAGFETLTRAGPVPVGSESASHLAGFLERRFPEGALQVFLFDGNGRLLDPGRSPNPEGIERLFAYICRPWTAAATLATDSLTGLDSLLPNVEDVANTLRGRPGRLMVVNDSATDPRVARWGFCTWREDRAGGMVPPITPGRKPKVGVAGLLAFGTPQGFSQETILREALVGLEVPGGFIGFLLPDGRSRISMDLPPGLIEALGTYSRRNPTGRVLFQDWQVITRSVGNGAVLVAGTPQWQETPNPLRVVISMAVLGSLPFLAVLYLLAGGRWRPRMRVSGKLMGLFMLVVGLPLAVSLCLSWLYLQEKRLAIQGELRSGALAWLNRLDAGIETTLTARERRYRRICGRETAVRPDARTLLRAADDLERGGLVDELAIIASQAGFLKATSITCRATFREALQLPLSDRMRRLAVEVAVGGRLPPMWVDCLLGRRGLEGVRDEEWGSEVRWQEERNAWKMVVKVLMGELDAAKGFPPALGDQSQLLITGSQDELPILLQSIQSTLGQLVISQTFTGDGYFYLDVVFGLDGRAEFFVDIIHRYGSLQLEYLRNLFRSSLHRRNGGEVFILGGKPPFAPSFPADEDRVRWQPILRELQLSGASSIARRLVIDGAEVEVVARRGTSLKYYDLLHVTPVSEIEARLRPFRHRALAFVGGTVLFGFALAYLLMRLFLVPVDELTRGVRALREHRFGHRVPVRRQDELGALCGALNQTIVHLSEMEMAAAIQKNLLPPQDFATERVSVAGRNQMTQAIGGDYFDYLNLPDGRVAVVLGDVSGHGVSAALVTAMAKAAFTLLFPRFPDRPEEVLRRVNEHLLAMLHKKKMMSCCVLVFDPATGRGRLANAGQCSPAVIDAAGRVRPAEMPSTPLGTMKKANIKTLEVDLAGGGIVFYSDGLIEALNQHNEVVGFERFYEIVEQSWSKAASTGDTLAAILDGVKGFTHPIPWADDVTLVMIADRSSDRGVRMGGPR